MNVEERQKNKPTYNNVSIYSLEVFKLFQADSDKVHDFFMKNLIKLNK